MTAFYAHTLPEHLAAAEDVLSDIMRPSLREADFNDEKSVILEEIAMYDDQPFWVLYERSLEAYYQNHPLSHRVLGTNDTITNLTAAQMRAYFEHRYSADNTVVALAGNLDFDAMVERIRSHCAHWPRTDAVRAYPAFNTTPNEFTIELDNVNLHYQLYIIPAPPMDDDRRHAAALLAQILGDAEGSRLYWALVDTGLAEEAQAQYEPHDGFGETFVYTSCDPAQADAVESVVRTALSDLVDSLTEDDALRMRSKVLTAATLHSERPSGRMNRLGRTMTYLGTYRSLEDELRMLDAVTLDDLREVAAAFPLTPVVTGRLTPA